MPPFLLTSIVLFLIWLAIILFSHKTRREQIIMSIVGLVLVPGILLIVSSDFRNVLSENSVGIGIEDFIFSGSIFGIASVIYHFLFGKYTHKMKGKKLDIQNPVRHWWTHMIIVCGLWMFSSLLLIHVFELSSIRALIVGGILIGTYIIADRHDLLLDALLSGLMVAVLVFVVEQIFFVRLFPDAAAGFWQFNATTSFMIGGIPLEEIIWAGVVGFAIGPMYEWLRRYELR